MNVNKLSDRAMLIQLSIKQWTGKHKDKDTSERVAVQANAERDAVDCIINLVSPAELQPINGARGRVFRQHKLLTLPWSDGGLRILASDMFFTYRDKMKKPIAEYNKVKDVFANRFPELIANAPKRLGNLPTGVMPSADQIKYRFRIEQNIMPLPNIADFRADWADDEAESIRQQVTADFETFTRRAIQDVWVRLSNMIEKIGTTMREDKKFHNSIIDNLKDFCILMPKFNITADEDLERIRKETLDKLAELDPEDLREIPNNRKKAAKDAKELVSKISQYMK